jgi:hypothetical protein
MVAGTIPGSTIRLPGLINVIKQRLWIVKRHFAERRRASLAKRVLAARAVSRAHFLYSSDYRVIATEKGMRPVAKGEPGTGVKTPNFLSML